MTDVERLVRLAESLGVEPEALDEAVHDLAQEVNLAELNTLEREKDQEESISAQERLASEVNNGGLESQVEFLLEHLTAAEAEAAIRAAR